MLNTLENLIKLARERKSAPVDGSYTNKLLTDKSFSKAKVLEEVDELIEAVEKDTNKIHEAADVLYHLLMYLEANDIKHLLLHEFYLNFPPLLQLIHQLLLKLLLCLIIYP